MNSSICSTCVFFVPRRVFIVENADDNIDLAARNQFHYINKKEIIHNKIIKTLTKIIDNILYSFSYHNENPDNNLKTFSIQIEDSF